MCMCVLYLYCIMFLVRILYLFHILVYIKCHFNILQACYQRNISASYPTKKTKYSILIFLTNTTCNFLSSWIQGKLDGRLLFCNTTSQNLVKETSAFFSLFHKILEPIIVVSRNLGKYDDHQCVVAMSLDSTPLGARAA